MANGRCGQSREEKLDTAPSARIGALRSNFNGEDERKAIAGNNIHAARKETCQWYVVFQLISGRNAANVNSQGREPLAR